MTCLRMPQSLEDAGAIVACYGGADWRANFVLGLETVLVVGIVLWVAFALAMRARA